MSKLTAERRAELRKLANAATPGPWKPCPMNMYVFAADGSPVSDTGEFDDESDGKPPGTVQRIRGFGAEVSGKRYEGSQNANIALIAAAREAVPALLDEIERLESELEDAAFEAMEALNRAGL
jgi:hypothetical protein